MAANNSIQFGFKDEAMKTSIPFMKYRKYATVLSVILVLLSIASLATKQLNFGLDFSGGTLLELEYPSSVEPSELRDTLENLGVENAVVQHFGATSEIAMRIPPQSEQVLASLATQSGLTTENNEAIAFGDHLLALLKNDASKNQSASGEIILKRNEFVGPSLGEELRDDGGIAMIVALACMLVYIGFRFHYRFGIGAVIALFHDVIITLGVFSFWQLSFDQSVLAAILAVIGYSLNDTIVVADRIRENFQENLDSTDNQGLIDLSLNQTLSRTLITSLTTFLVLLALYLFGGPSLELFSMALMVGIVVGTYSSVYVASNALISLGVMPSQFLVVEVLTDEEEEELDFQP